MKNKIIFILFSFLFTINLFAEYSNKQNEDEVKKEKFYYLKDPLSTYDPSTCTHTCPPMASGYFGRIVNVEPTTGSTTCRIYKNEDPYTPVSAYTFVNTACVKEYKKSDVKINKNKRQELNNFGDKLERLIDKYQNNYTQTGSIKFLTLADYLLAIITVDPSVINIKETLRINQIKLQSNYTISANNTTNNGSWTKDISRDFENLKIRATNLFNSIFGGEKLELKTYLKTEDDVFNDTVFTAVGTIGVWWIDLLTEFDSAYVFANFMIILLILPFTLAISTAEKALDKRERERNTKATGIVAAFIALTMFYAPFEEKTGTKNIFNEDKQISQTFFQTTAREFIYGSLDIVKYFNDAFTVVTIRQLAKNADINPLINEEQLKVDLEQAIKVQKFYKTYLIKCEQLYNVDSLALMTDKIYGGNIVYPPNEIHENMNFYDGYLKSGSLYQNSLYSVDSCYLMNRKRADAVSEISRIQKAQALRKTAQGDGIEDRILTIAEVALKTKEDMGFLSLGSIFTFISAISNTDEDFKSELDELSEKREQIREQSIANVEDRKEGVMNTISNGVNLLMTNSYTTDIIYKNMAYEAMPFYQDVKKPVETMVNDLFKVLENAVNSKAVDRSDGLKRARSKLKSFRTNVFRKMTDHKKPLKARVILGTIKGALSVGKVVIIRWITNYIYEELLNVFLSLAVSSAFFIVVFYYLIKVIIYYLVSPFFFAYGMTKGQGEAYKKFLGQGIIILAFPTLIMFGVVIAYLAVHLFSDIVQFLVTYNYKTIYHVNELGFISTLRAGLEEQTLIIGLNFLTPIIAFVLILSTPVIIQRSFGYTDEADIGTQIGQSLEMKGGKHLLPM